MDYYPPVTLREVLWLCAFCVPPTLLFALVGYATSP